MSETHANRDRQGILQALEQWYLDRGLVFPPRAIPKAIPPVTNITPRWLVFVNGSLDAEESSLLTKMLAAIQLSESSYALIDLASDQGQAFLSEFTAANANEPGRVGLVFGERALKHLTSGAQVALETMRGTWFSTNLVPGVALMPTWHPKDLIAMPDRKRSAWSDLQLAQKRPV